MQDQNEKTFSKLPLEIVEEVVKRLDPISRIVIRNVSKMLRAVSTRQKLSIREMQILEESGKICLKINGDSVTFPVLNFLRLILSNPKLKIDHLHLTGSHDPKVFEKIIDIFKGSSFHVKSVKIETHFPVPTDANVSFMKPGVLESIEIDQHLPRGEVDSLSLLLGTEQFEQAKSVIWTCGYLDYPHIDLFLHLESFEMKIEYFPANKIKAIRDALANRPNFKRCKIRARCLYLPDIAEQLVEIFPEVFPFRHRHPIPGSNDFLHVTVERFDVYFERERVE